jgi:hypothetical protein
VTLLSPSCFVFFSCVVAMQRRPSYACCGATELQFPFIFHLPAEKLRCKEGWNFVLKKKMTATATFFALLQRNGEFVFLLWFCWKEGDGSNVVAFVYGGGYYYLLLLLLMM